MRVPIRSVICFSMAALIASVVFASCESPANSGATVSAAGAGPAAAQEKGGQEEFGPYQVAENWPQPLQDGPDGVKHEGWTWGSVGAVWA